MYRVGRSTPVLCYMNSLPDGGAMPSYCAIDSLRVNALSGTFLPGLHPLEKYTRGGGPNIWYIIHVRVEGVTR